MFRRLLGVVSIIGTLSLYVFGVIKVSRFLENLIGPPFSLYLIMGGLLFYPFSIFLLYLIICFSMDLFRFIIKGQFEYFLADIVWNNIDNTVDRYFNWCFNEKINKKVAANIEEDVDYKNAEIEIDNFLKGEIK